MHDPIIIGGSPRTGTTTTAFLIGSHERIAVTSEINPEAAELACAMMHRLSRYMSEPASRRRVWDRNRQRLMIEIWKSVTSPALLRDQPEDARIAHKTPGAEEFFEDYLRIFEPARPRLVYCLRDGVKVMRSLLNMPWRPVPLEERVEQYKASVTTYERLHARFPDLVYRFQIDKVDEAPEQRRAQAAELFEFLGERLTDDVRDFVERWPSKNTMRELKDRGDVQELTAEHLQLLAHDEEFVSIQRRYGYDTLLPHLDRPWSRCQMDDLQFDRQGSAWAPVATGRPVDIRFPRRGQLLGTTELEEGARYRYRSRRRPFPGPCGPGSSSAVGQQVHYEIHVDLGVLDAEPEVQLSATQYGHEEPIGEESVRLRGGRNVLAFLGHPGTEAVQLELQLSGKGRFRLSDFAAVSWVRPVPAARSTWAPTTAIRGLARDLVTRLRRQLDRRSQRSFTVEITGPSRHRDASFRIVADRGLYVPRVLERRGLAAYDPDTMAAFLACVERVPGAVLDIGANVGVYAVTAAACLPDRSIVAVEPTPELARTAEEIVRYNQLDVSVEELAFGSETGTATLYLSSVTDSSNSLNPAFREHHGRVEVSVEELDRFCARRGLRPGLLKIDTESTEPDVLRGASRTLREARPWIICEVLAGRSEEALMDLLNPHGYRWFHITDGSPFPRRSSIAGDPDHRFLNWLFTPEEPDDTFWRDITAWREALATSTVRSHGR